MQDKLDVLLEGLDAGPSRRKTLQCRLDHFLRLAGSDSDAIRYREIARQQGYSPATIEATVDLIRRLNPGTPVGRRIKIPSPDPCPPSIDSINAAYRAASVAAWPRWITPAIWWRAFFAVACWTGFRLSDLLSLTPENMSGNWITLQAGKTGKTHRIPKPAFLDRHIKDLCKPGEPIFKPTGSRKQFRRELRRIQREARIEKFTPQNLRQFAITHWSIADTEAGRIIHGCGLGGHDVMLHYVRRPTILLEASTRVRMPDCFLSESARLALQDGEKQVLKRFREASTLDKQIILSLVNRLS